MRKNNNQGIYKEYHIFVIFMFERSVHIAQLIKNKVKCLNDLKVVIEITIINY
jgi:hypothetical protein